MSYKKGTHRNQQSLFPEAPPAPAPKSGPALMIDAFADQLDLREIGVEHGIPAITGRPPYDPRDLVKLHLYGSVRGIRSSRRLERAAARDTHLTWLIGGLKPKHKTIADFKKKNRQALQKAVRQFAVQFTVQFTSARQNSSNDRDPKKPAPGTRR